MGVINTILTDKTVCEGSKKEILQYLSNLK